MNHAIVWPKGTEPLVMVAAVPNTTAFCECGGPLVTPRVSADFAGTVDLDWLRCPRCHAHCIVRVRQAQLGHG